MDFGEIARRRVAEPLLREKIDFQDTVHIRSSGILEPWAIVSTVGKAPPYGILESGRVLVLLSDFTSLDSDPLAGLVWSKERGKKYIHQIWVDPSVQRSGIARILIEVYRKHVSRSVVISGPFSDAGRAFSQSIGATIVNDTVSEGASRSGAFRKRPTRRR